MPVNNSKLTSKVHEKGWVPDIFASTPIHTPCLPIYSVNAIKLQLAWACNSHMFHPASNWGVYTAPTFSLSILSWYLSLAHIGQNIHPTSYTHITTLQRTKNSCSHILPTPSFILLRIIFCGSFTSPAWAPPFPCFWSRDNGPLFLGSSHECGIRSSS